MLIDLANKTALVTGAGSGIGRGCALALAEAGAFVFVNDLDAEKAGAVAQEINGQALTGDVAEPGDWLNPVLTKGPLHVLVHNAGYDLYTPVGETDMDAFKRLHAVMLTGPYSMVQLLLPSLKMANGAAIIFIASVHGQATTPNCSAYAAAKGGQIAMVRSMCQDLGPFNIRALSVSPGYVDTLLIRQWLDASRDPSTLLAKTQKLHPMGRIGTPEDIGGLVAFLASPLAEYINGVNVTIDGGLTARLLDCEYF
jgi:NAD(P)-dependent dehydrogenase (short-subunit alcohol dehydrogenase family)